MDDKELDMIPEEEPHEEQITDEDTTSDEVISPEDTAVEDASEEDISDEDISDEETDEEDITDDASDESYDDEDDSDEDDEDEYDDDEDEDERPRRRKKKSSAGRLIFALVMVTLVISVAVLGAVFVIKTAKEILGLNRSTVEYAIEIPSDSGTEAIANILAQEHIIEEPMLFRIVSKIKGADGTYIAGIHKLSPNMTYGDIIEELQKESINPREFVDITFPEGIRLIDAAKKLEEAGVCNADEFIQAINSTTFGFDFEKEVKASAQKFYKMEGYFFPDTYQFYLDEDPKNVVKKVFKNFDHNVTPNHLGRMEDIGMSLNEVITLASIVQAEAGNVRDMKLVASVFHNRLNAPDEFPLLQSDPTSKYVREVIEPNLEIYSKTICEAYDTYKGGGLPPGPICNPGIDAIEAVLYPRETNYYFFCSDLETGEFFYAETLDEHEANLVAAHLVAE